MPRFFDDYSNTYLTHDSAAGRKQQRRGWKFRENFKLHYEKHLDEWRAGPMGLASAQQSFLRTRRDANGNIQDMSLPPLPEGWVEELDGATGVHYYANDDTGERSWVRPGFRPPGPGQGLAPPMMGGPPPPTNFQRPPPSFQQPPPVPPQFSQPPPMMSGRPPPHPGQFAPPPPPNMSGPPSGVPHFAAPPAFPPPPPK